MKLLLETIINIVGDLFGFLFDALGKWLSKDHRYKGRFGKTRRVLKRRHKQNGIAIGQDCISLKESLNGGMMLIGSTGVGKSSKIFKMQMLGITSNSPSFVNLDVAGDIREDCYHATVASGHSEEILNFSDASKSTITWNPLDAIAYDMVNRFANDFVAINMGAEPKDPIWSLMSSTLIGIIIRLLKSIGIKDYINLYNARFLIKTLQSEPAKIDALVAKYGDETLFLDYRAFVSNEEKFLNSVLSNTLASLQQWEDPNVIKTTSTSTLDMSSYHTEKKILYLQNEVMSQSYLASLNSLFFMAWFSFITSEGIPDKEDNIIAFGIDEASSLKMKKDILPLAVSQIRKYKSYGVFGYQSFSQVQDLLGFQGAETLRQNTGTVLYLGNQDLDTGTQISRSLGRYSYEEDGVQKVREILTPEEAMHLDNCKSGGILFSGQNRPMRLKRIKAFYEIPKYRKIVEQATPPIEEMYHQMPPLLPIDELVFITSDAQ